MFCPPCKKHQTSFWQPFLRTPFLRVPLTALLLGALLIAQGFLESPGTEGLRWFEFGPESQFGLDHHLTYGVVREGVIPQLRWAKSPIANR